MLKMALLFEQILRDGLVACLWLLAAVVAASLLYSLFLLLAAAADRRRRRSQADRALDNPPRFLILIPAHNEELVIGSTLAALAHVEYPLRPRIVVIADNCGDDTAQAARRMEGVEVLERVDPNAKGKGFALNWALAQLLPNRDFDLVAIIDADTQMDRGFLCSMAKAFRAGGGEGYFAAQGCYQVLNEGECWRTALMAGALSLVHYVRPIARERLRLSCGLKGNGMCLSASVLSEIAWRGESLTEDIEYALDLTETHRVRVQFVPDAIVRAQMPANSKSAGSQRRRWERGRYQLMRSRGPGLLAQGILHRNRLALDCALDLFVPPLAEIVVLWIVWGALLLAAKLLGEPGVGLLFGLWAACAVALAVYVIGGFAVARAPRVAYGALLFAPVYVVWKMLTYAARKRDEGWVRTERAPLANTTAPSEPLEAVNK